MAHKCPAPICHCSCVCPTVPPTTGPTITSARKEADWQIVLIINAIG